MLFLREAMPCHRVFRLVLLTLCSILVPAVLTGKELCLHLKPKIMGDLLLYCPFSPFPENIPKYVLN